MTNNINILNDDFSSEIKFIYHISDVHIKAIINKVTNIIKSNTGRSLIVITGDTLDTVYTVQCIDMTKLFFHKFAMLAPIIYIIGNHEMQCKRDVDGSDMITPLVSNYFESKHKIYPLLKEGLYKYNNVIFGLTKMKSIEVFPCSPKIKEYAKYIKIGLHHGQVSYDKMDPIVKKQCNLDVKQFEQYYDYTLLGDCHGFTFLNNDKTVAYSGSLYETNFRETNIPKGLIKWDLTKEKAEFVRIDGIIKHVILKVIDGKLTNYNKSKIPMKAKIKVIYSNIITDDLDKNVSRRVIMHFIGITIFSVMINCLTLINFINMTNFIFIK